MDALILRNYNDELFGRFWQAFEEKNFQVAMECKTRFDDEMMRHVYNEVFCASWRNVEEINFFLDMGMDVNYNSEIPVLSYIVSFGDPDKTKLILEKGANVNKKDVLGRNVIFDVADAADFTRTPGFNDVLELLLEYGCDLDLVTNEGENILLYISNHVIDKTSEPEYIREIYEPFIRAGVDLKARHENGKLFLDLINDKDKKIVADLIECNPNNIKG